MGMNEITNTSSNSSLKTFFWNGCYSLKTLVDRQLSERATIHRNCVHFFGRYPSHRTPSDGFLTG